MKIETAIKKLVNTYNEAKDNQAIRKPVAYSLYTVWRYADAYEKERSGREGLRRKNNIHPKDGAGEKGC